MLPRVLFLYTGGTLGMTSRDPGPLEPSLLAGDVLTYLRGLEREVDVTAELLCNEDSTDLGPADWERIGARVAEELDAYAGFVVVHGTDTMAWTASALSYMLRGLTKPVVLTGAQRPIAKVRTDARTNLIHAALCASMDLPEVSIFFGRCLYRGNRSTKTDIQAYDAFISPNLAPLLEMGVECEKGTPPLRPTGPFRFEPGFERRVEVVSVTPGTGPGAIDRAVEAGARGVVVRAFGAGNVPREAWPGAIRRATDAGVPVAITSQCTAGAIDLTAYQGGRAALDNGAWSAGAMTVEAATTKLMYVLRRTDGAASARTLFETDLAGEGAARAGG